MATDGKRESDQSRTLRAPDAHLDRLVTLGQLAAAAAHDINGQLLAARHNVSTALRIAHQLATLGTVTEASALLEVLSDVERAASQIANIVQGMTVYARADRLNFEPVYLHEIAATALRITHGLVGSKARVESRLDPVPPRLGRSAALVQIVVNLILNAAQALEASGTSDACIALATRADPRGISLLVEDNGPGVASELRGQIFEPFFTTKAPGYGTGLGLAIARQIALEHGGRLDLLQAREGEGARFELWLPLDASAPPDDC